MMTLLETDWRDRDLLKHMDGKNGRPVHSDDDIASPLHEPWLRIDDIADSFDEDLDWILARFAERTGAQGCALTLHHPENPKPRTLLLTGVLKDTPEEDGTIGSIAQRCGSFGRGNPAAREPRWSGVACLGQEWRMLSLPLAGNDHDRLVISTLHPMASPIDPKFAELAASKLHPVLAGYFKLWLLTRSYRRRMNDMMAALNYTDIGTILLGQTGDLLLVNQSAEAILNRADGLRRNGSSIAAVDLGDALRLRVMIDHVIEWVINPDPQRPPRRAPIARLRRRGSEGSYFIAVLPVNRTVASPGDAAVVIYVFSPELDMRGLLDPVCTLYGLSPGETRLVGLIASGYSVAEAAARLKLKEQTIRAYLKHIFIKTGTTRQADLVRMMMGSLLRLQPEFDPLAFR